MSLILHVDDDLLLQLDGRDVLESAGHEPLMAASGPEACAHMLAQGGRLDALLTDINLGGEMDGWQVADAGREIRPSLPVIYLSASDASVFHTRGVPDSVWISKPLVWPKVMEVLQGMLAADVARDGRENPKPEPLQ